MRHQPRVACNFMHACNCMHAAVMLSTHANSWALCTTVLQFNPTAGTGMHRAATIQQGERSPGGEPCNFQHDDVGWVYEEPKRNGNRSGAPQGTTINDCFLPGVARWLSQPATGKKSWLRAPPTRVTLMYICAHVDRGSHSYRRFAWIHCTAALWPFLLAQRRHISELYLHP